ncbi:MULTISPECIES: conjugative transposon protein TraM [Rikenellaceae]|uniref:Conjugative transposon TraM C-terminal domain-containing protein n=1 Tax=Alistipes inops TaxID=1501391 RepID=A0ABR4YHA4_9BACT|nr:MULTISPECIES: conjugative transposon protein TraM [Rikenellaceae]KHE40623.1 hypothetical protein LG35_09820 [Alistipes inops]
MAATQPGKESQQASKQKAWQHLRSGLAIGAMTALCGGFLWMLYAPQEKTPGNEMFEGFDTSIPDATVSEMNADKRKVYEEIHRQELWQDKVRSLEDFSEDTLLSDSMTRIETSPTPGAGASAIDASHDTYRTLNRQIASFYRPTPAEDPRVADLQRQVEELTRRLESRTSPSVEHPTADEVLERSYALAARYFPNGAADGREPVAASVPATVSPAEQITVVRPVTSVVSTLALPDTLPDIPRNRAFRTAVGPDTTTPTGMIHACIAGEQRIAAGERVRLRLLDRVQAGETLLPEGTIIYGTATISGQRLGIRVQSLASDAGLLTVNLTAYDTDGQPGLFIPDTAERSALKEAAASAGNNLGSGITVTRGAGQQIASDLTRSLLSGGTKYLSAKLREVRITLKAGHTLFLVSEQ